MPPGGWASPFLPVYALQEPEVELLLRVLWPARVVDEHQAGWRAPPDLPVGWEGEVHLAWGVTSLGVEAVFFNVLNNPESTWGLSAAKAQVPPC